MSRTKKTRKERKTHRKLSEYEKIYARMLWGDGKNHLEIAESLHVSKSTIGNLRARDKGDGIDWNAFTLPDIEFPGLVKILKDEIIRDTLDIANDAARSPEKRMEQSVLTEKILNRMRVVKTLSYVQEHVDSVSLRDTMFSMQRFMKWVVGKTFDSVYEAAQAFHDECGEQL